MFQEIKRVLNPIKRKIQLMIAKAVITSIDNSQLNQKVNMNVFAGEQITDVERVQEYGLETYPHHMIWKPTTKNYEGSDSDNSKQAQVKAVTIFQNGDHGRGLVIAISDRYYRLSDLVEGEVALYTSEDKYNTEGHRIHLKNGCIINLKGKILDVDVTSIDIDATGASAITIGGNSTETITGTKTITASSVTINCNVTVVGDISDSQGTAQTMKAMRTTFDNHTHPYTDDGNPMTTSATATKMG